MIRRVVPKSLVPPAHGLDRLPGIGRVSLATGLFGAPVVFNPASAEIFNLTKSALVWLSVVAALVAWSVWAIERRSGLPRVAIWPYLAGLLGAVSLATIASRAPVLSAIGLYTRYGGLLSLILAAGLVLGIVALFADLPDRLLLLATATAMAGVASAAYVLLQWAGVDWLRWREASGAPVRYPAGPLGNSNFAGAFLAMTVPHLVLVIRRPARQWLRRVAVPGLPAVVAAVAATQSRGGLVGLAAAIVTMVWLEWRRLHRWVLPAVAGALAAVVVVVVLGVWHPGLDRPPGGLERLGVFRTESLAIRAHSWAVAWKTFVAHPVVGTGPETFYASYPQYRSRADGAQFGLLIPDKPHNLFLEQAATAGIIGLLAFAALFTVVLKNGLQRARANHPDPLLVSFLGVVIGYLAASFFSFDVPAVAATAWAAVGGIVVLSDPRLVARRREAQTEVTGRRPRRSNTVDARAQRKGRGDRRVAQAGVVAAAALVLATLARPVLADIRFGTGNPAAAVALHEVESAYHEGLALDLEHRAVARPATERRQLLTPAARSYRRALELRPGNIPLMVSLARAHALLGDAGDENGFREADRWYRSAVRRDRYNWEVHNHYALALNAWSNAREGSAVLRRRAATEFQRVVALRPEHVPAWLNLARTRAATGDASGARAAADRALTLDPGNADAAALLRSLPPG